MQYSSSRRVPEAPLWGDFWFQIDPQHQELKKQSSIIGKACLRMKVVKGGDFPDLKMINELFHRILDLSCRLGGRCLNQKRWVISSSQNDNDVLLVAMLPKYKLKIQFFPNFFDKTFPYFPTVSSKSRLDLMTHPNIQTQKMIGTNSWSSLQSMIDKIIVPNSDKSSLALNFLTIKSEWDLFLKTLSSFDNDEVLPIAQLLSKIFTDESAIADTEKLNNGNRSAYVLNMVAKSIVPDIGLISLGKIAKRFDENNVESWPIGMACFLHFCKQKNYPNIKHLSFNDEAEILSASGRFLANIKGFSSIGLLFHLKALCLRKKNQRPLTAANYINMAANYTNIGMSLRDLGYNEKALEYFQKVLDLRKQFSKEGNTVAIARSYTNIGMIQNDLGNYREGLESIRTALKIQKKKNFSKYPTIQNDKATSYHNKGISFRGLSLDEKTSKYLERSRELRENSFRENHPLVGISYNDLGMHLWEMGKFEEAMVNLKRALKIQENILGESHPLVATCYNNIGLCAIDLKDSEKALENLNKALEIRQQILEKNHPCLASSYLNLGRYYKEFKGEESEEVCDNDEIDNSYNKALEFFKKALVIFETLNNTHPCVAICNENIGLTLMLLNRYDEAKSYLGKVW